MRAAASTMDGTSAIRAGPRHGRYLATGDWPSPSSVAAGRR
jgi:hypothetical protein